MIELTPSEIVAFVMRNAKPKEYKRLWPQAEFLLARMHKLHLAYIDGLEDDEYQEDDAFEAVYAQLLSSLPQEEDEDLAVAALLNAYFEALDELE